VLGVGSYRGDAPMHKGLDDRVSTYKVQSLAQDLAADAFGAETALFSTNGSTLSVQIAVLAATHPGQCAAPWAGRSWNGLMLSLWLCAP
jgi:arginine/lysine/ornithine decarboxylase